MRERIGGTRPRVDEAGQVSCETEIPADIFRPKVLADTKPQAFVPGAKNQAQNVANTTYELAVFQRGTGVLNGEPLIEWHEIKSDFGRIARNQVGIFTGEKREGARNKVGIFGRTARN